jgi:hypothetical protein
VVGDCAEKNWGKRAQRMQGDVESKFAVSLMGDQCWRCASQVHCSRGSVVEWSNLQELVSSTML